MLELVVVSLQGLFLEMSFLQHYTNCTHKLSFLGGYALWYELDLLENGQHAI